METCEEWKPDWLLKDSITVLDKVERMFKSGFPPLVLLPASFTPPFHPASEFSRSCFQCNELFVCSSRFPKGKVREKSKFQ